MSYSWSPFGMGNFDAVSSSGPDERKVREIVGEILTEEKNLGNFDDTKIYETYAAMEAAEPVGREDVLYIIATDDTEHGTRYIWTGGENGHYEPIQDTLTSEDILDIVNS